MEKYTYNEQNGLYYEPISDYYEHKAFLDGPQYGAYLIYDLF